MIMVLFGPPGCGKGTQAGIIAKDIEIPHLSTGDMLRDAVKSKTETGLKAASIMEAVSYTHLTLPPLLLV